MDDKRNGGQSIVYVTWLIRIDFNPNNVIGVFNPVNNIGNIVMTLN